MSTETPPATPSPDPSPAPLPPAAVEAPTSPAPVPASARSQPGFAKRVWNYLTSFQFAVLILTLSMLLVLGGTIAQVNEGLYLAQSRWFKSWFIIRHSGDPWWVLYYPGGYLLGTLFLINMLGAHFRRLKYPPGGLVVMTVHYLIVMAVLFFTTKSLLWMPFYFVLSQAVLIVVDLAACKTGSPLESSGRKIGVDLVHLGIAVLLLGQLSTDLFARESQMAIYEGQTKHYSEDFMDSELAFSRSSDDKNDEVTVIPGAIASKATGPLTAEKLPFSVTIKQWMINSSLIDRDAATQALGQLQQAFATVESTYSSADNLPAAAAKAAENPGRVLVWEEALRNLGEPPGVNIEEAAKRIATDAAKSKTLLEALKTGFRKQMTGAFQMGTPSAAYVASQLALGKKPEDVIPPPQVDAPLGKNFFVAPLPETRAMDTTNIPGAIIELSSRDNTPLGTWFVTPDIQNLQYKDGTTPKQTVVVAGQEYRFSLRFTRVYHDFGVTLLKATRENYPGTQMPKDFRSLIRIQDNAGGGDRETEIFMNSPLRFENGNLTFFQSKMDRRVVNGEDKGSSGFQVVRNPGWFSPYFGCALVAYGMCRHFLLHLGRFISKKKAS